MRESEIAYLAGLFDGEGHIQYKQYNRKRSHNKKAYPTWSIRMEMSMTDESIIRYTHEVLGVGTVNKRKNGRGSLGRRQQWRWQCGYRDAYQVCVLFWPHAHVKLEKIQKIIDHYSADKIMDGNVVDLQHYRMWMNLE